MVSLFRKWSRNKPDRRTPEAIEFPVASLAVGKHSKYGTVAGNTNSQHGENEDFRKLLALGSAYLVWHVDGDTLLEHGHGGVGVTAHGSHVHQRTAVVRPTRHVRVKLVDEHLDDR